MILEDSKKRVKVLICLGIVVATLVAYEPMRHNDFVAFDDDRYITENPDIKSGITWQSLSRVFKPHFYMWHPLTTFTNMVDCEFFGLNPFWHHLVNLLIHIVNAVLLFWLLTNLTGSTWASAFVAGVFALHPLQVESVAWAAERKTVLSGLFWFLTMGVYTWYTKRPSIRRYMLLFGIYALCIMTKPVVVTLPFALLLLDYWPLERLSSGIGGVNPALQLRRLLIEKVPLLVLSGILCVITFFVQKQGGVIKTFEQMPLDNRIANAFISYIRYIGKMIWPSELAAIYPYPRINLTDVTAVTCLVLFVLISILSIYVGRRKKYVLMGWLWFAGTLVPMIGLVQAGSQVMADRYMYLSMLGLLFIAAWSVKDIIADHIRWKVVTAVSAAFLLSAAVIFTRMDVRYWENSMTLFERVLEVTENNAGAEFGYGCVLLKSGRLEEAAEHLSNAVRIEPAFFDARNNLGVVYLKLGRFDEATACFNEILRYEDSPQSHYYLGVISYAQTKYDDAIKELTTAVNKGLKYPDAYNKMGVALLATGKPKEAIEYLNEALRQEPNGAEVYANLGRAYKQIGKNDLAIKNWTRALELRPNNVNILNSLGWLMATADDASAENAARAVELSERACELSSYKRPEFIDTLAAAYAAAGRFDEAVKTAKRAIEAAKAAGQEDKVGEIQNRIELYQAGERYRQRQKTEDR